MVGGGAPGAKIYVVVNQSLRCIRMDLKHTLLFWKGIQQISGMLLRTVRLRFTYRDYEKVPLQKQDQNKIRKGRTAWEERQASTVVYFVFVVVIITTIILNFKGTTSMSFRSVELLYLRWSGDEHLAFILHLVDKAKKKSWSLLHGNLLFFAIEENWIVFSFSNLL